MLLLLLCFLFLENTRLFLEFQSILITADKRACSETFWPLKMKVQLFFRNVGNYAPADIVSYLGRPEFSLHISRFLMLVILIAKTQFVQMTLYLVSSSQLSGASITPTIRFVVPFIGIFLLYLVSHLISLTSQSTSN